MLGNWSFGDYFKKEAIEWAWEYLVDVLKIDPDRLYATVFEGNAEEGLVRDSEAFEYWSKHLPAHRIVNGNKKDNFWEMGDTGPCGPCSEIHIDLRDPAARAVVPGEQLVNKDNPEVIEIWNLVFIQYNRKADGSLESLPQRHIDTGMGFERLTRAIQGKTSNYDTDVFQPIIQEISNIAGIKYGAARETDVAMRVVADHIRTISFAICDGQLPSNNKAGYVIRRILRRAWAPRPVRTRPACARRRSRRPVRRAVRRGPQRGSADLRPERALHQPLRRAEAGLRRDRHEVPHPRQHRDDRAGQRPG